MISTAPRKKANGDALIRSNLMGMSLGTWPLQASRRISRGSNLREASIARSERPILSRCASPNLSACLRVDTLPPADACGKPKGSAGSSQLIDDVNSRATAALQPRSAPWGDGQEREE